MRKVKKSLSALLALVLMLCTVPIGNLPAKAATFEDINQSGIFVKQQTNYTCTLASAVMLVRRTALASGNNNWSSITESSMRGTAWLEDSGLYYNFTFAGVSVGHANAGSDKKSFYINLLKQYPQGVVAYNSGNSNQWHAILLTDYNSSTDTFYCADPANGTASVRITLSSSSIVGSGQNGKINNLNEYWYVKSPSINLTSSDNVAPTIHGTYIGNEIPDHINYFRACCIVSDNIGISKVMLATWSDPNQADLVWRECYHNGSGIYFMDIKYSSHASGAKIYYNHFYVYDTAGNCSFADITFNRYPIVTFNPTGGTAYKTTKNSSFTLTYGWYDYNTVDWLAPQKNGYTFKGWYDKETGGNLIYDVNGKAINDNNHWKSDWCVALNDYMVYAQWICNHAAYTSTVTEAATCISTGMKTYTCTTCGYSYTETIPKNASNHTGGTTVKDIKTATCIAEGYTGDTYCLDCNTKIKSGTTTAKNASNHTGGTTVKNERNATCKADGYTGDNCCSGCGTVLSQGNIIPKTAHKYVIDNVIEATCQTNGMTVRKCTVCGDQITEVIPKKGHSDINGDGKCDDCGKEISSTTPDDPSENCSCNCHKGGFAGFIWKIGNIFNKIFKISNKRYCACGKDHYA